MKASVSVLVFRDDGTYGDYVKHDVELSCVPEQGDLLNFAGMKLAAWSVGPYDFLGPRFERIPGYIVICRVDPAEINRRTACRKLVECGFKCKSRCRRRAS